MWHALLYDACDINRGRIKLIRQINNVICYFRNLDCFTLLQLPLADEIVKRILEFSRKYLSSDSP